MYQNVYGPGSGNVPVYMPGIGPPGLPGLLPAPGFAPIMPVFGGMPVGPQANLLPVTGYGVNTGLPGPHGHQPQGPAYNPQPAFGQQPAYGQGNLPFPSHQHNPMAQHLPMNQFHFAAAAASNAAAAMAAAHAAPGGAGGGGGGGRPRRHFTEAPPGYDRGRQQYDSSHQNSDRDRPADRPRGNDRWGPAGGQGYGYGGGGGGGGGGGEGVRTRHDAGDVYLDGGRPGPSPPHYSPQYQPAPPGPDRQNQLQQQNQHQHQQQNQQQHHRQQNQYQQQQQQQAVDGGYVRRQGQGQVEPRDPSGGDGDGGGRRGGKRGRDEEREAEGSRRGATAAPAGDGAAGGGGSQPAQGQQGQGLGPGPAAADGNAGGPGVAGGDVGGGGGRRHRPPSHVNAVLGRNIEALVAELTPTEEEQRKKEEALQRVREAAAAAFPELRGRLHAEPFGSYVCGLGTRSSDIDVVLVGLAEPSPSLGFYSREERPRIGRMLDRLQPPLRRLLRPSKLVLIRHARVPIIKCTTPGQVSVDISIAGMTGPRAAQFIRQQVATYPALRPLVLVLKSYMRAEGLGEVASGGLSSYGLTYMTLAHLMEESRRGSDLTDLGGLLHSLVRRFGRSFDMNSMAVSVRHGGLVPKAALRDTGHTDHGDRIVTIDPLTGRNCTEGTFRSAEVLDALARADSYLAAWAARREQDVPGDADILGPLVSEVPDEEQEPYMQEYAPPANGGALGKRGRSQELNLGRHGQR